MTPYVNQPAWHMLTVVGDGSQSTFYVDGAQAGSAMPWVTTTDIGQVGGQNDQGRNLAQYVDNVSVYQSALSAAQVVQLYNSSTPQTVSILPAASPVSVAAGATLDVLNPNVPIGPLGDDSGSGGTVNLHGNTLTVNNADGAGNPVNSTFSGQIVGAGGALVKIGSGTFTLAGSNTYSGATAVNAGALQLANANAVQNSTVTVSANNALQFAAGVGTFTLGGLAGTGNVALQDAASGAVTLQVGNNNAGSVYNGNLSGAGSLVKTGTGTLILAGAGSSYSGATRVIQGTLQLGQVAPAGAAACYTFDNLSGSTIINSGSSGATYNGALFGAAAISSSGGLNGGPCMTLPSGGTASGLYLGAAGVPVPDGKFTASLWFYGLYDGSGYRSSFQSYNSERYMYILSQDSNQYLESWPGGFNTGTFSMAPYTNQQAWHMLTIVGNGTTSTYYVDGAQAGTPLSAVTNLDIGQVGGEFGNSSRNLAQKIDDVSVYQTALSAAQVLQLYDSALPQASFLLATSPVSIAAGATLDVVASNLSIGPLADDSGAGGTVNLHANTLTVNNADGSGNPVNSSFSGQITGIGGALVKTGGGMLVLSGTDTYTGGTDVEGGTLYVANSSAIDDGTSLIVGANGTVVIGSPDGATLAATSHAASPAGVIAAVPEPGAAALLSVAGILMAAAAWRKRKGI